ncbi:MAG: TRAP transporter substrate-binding protein [Eubacteriales bacterium]|nr:TRAP transporter substrate-binding protein [Eubacteriales bacterium]
MNLKKALALILAAGVVSTTFAAPVFAADDHYPGYGVYYRENDPEINADVEITSEDKITWTIASCMTEENPQSVNIARIAEELSEKTNGNFEWDIFYNSELGSESEAVELVRNNTAQFVTSNVTVMSSYVDAIGVFALPYLFHSAEDELTYLATSPVAYDLWKQLEESTNLVSLGFQCSGSRCLSTKGVEGVKSPADLSGVKVRSMEAKVWQDVITALGATPVPVAYTELYTALQTGVVQGQDNPAANTVDGKFYEVLDTFYKTEHSYLISAFYTNNTAWDALPDDYKALLGGLLQKYLGDSYKTDIDAFLDESLTIMEDAGVTIVEQSDLDMDAFYASAADMIEANYASNETYAPIIEDVKTTFGY